MTRLKPSHIFRRTRRNSRQWNLFVLAGLPLAILHAGLLLQRAMHQETLDALVVLRWSLAVVLLALLRRMAPVVRPLRSPTLGIAAILIFAMIHLPVAAPEPSLPLSATGLGLALTLAVVDRRCGVLAAIRRIGQKTPTAASDWLASVSRRLLNDRAPPVAA